MPSRAPVESLERRALLSATLEDSVLTITGTEGPDIGHLNLNGDLIAFGFVGGPGQAVPLSDVRLVILRGLGGDDQLLVSDGSAEEGEPAFNVPLILDGGAGDDLLARGHRATTPALLLGGAGDDTLVGGPGTDVADGGTGDDTITGNAGDDILFGGPGHDRLDGGTGHDVLRQNDSLPFSSRLVELLG